LQCNVFSIRHGYRTVRVSVLFIILTNPREGTLNTILPSNNGRTNGALTVRCN